MFCIYGTSRQSLVFFRLTVLIVILSMMDCSGLVSMCRSESSRFARNVNRTADDCERTSTSPDPGKKTERKTLDRQNLHI